MTKQQLASCAASRTFAAAVVAVAATLTAAGSCGLVNSDIATLSFDLPAKTYTFDADMAGASQLPQGTLPTVPCPPVGDCCSVAAVAGITCGPQLTLECDSGSGSCAATIPVQSPPQSIDLKSE